MNQEENQPFFELRRYDIKAGKLAEWVAYMDETLIPFQRSCGMVVVGSWSVAETNQYIWMRRFESEEERVRLYQAVYEHDYWLNEAKPMVETMLDRENGVHVTRISPTPRSIIR